MHKIKVRSGMPSVQLTRREFEKRFRAKFYDPLFDALGPTLDKVVDTAWTVYNDYHKSPRVHRAGKGYANPDYELPDEWRATSAAIKAAERQQTGFDQQLHPVDGLVALLLDDLELVHEVGRGFRATGGAVVGADERAGTEQLTAERGGNIVTGKRLHRLDDAQGVGLGPLEQHLLVHGDGGP